jgi:hypothetical protein
MDDYTTIPELEAELIRVKLQLRGAEADVTRLQAEVASAYSRGRDDGAAGTVDLQAKSKPVKVAPPKSK